MQGAATKNKKIDWTVLIVDDTQDNLNVTRFALKFHGIQVYTAVNGQESLGLLQQITPTVILLDVQMPVMDGWQTIRALRDNPATCHIPVIALTAYAMEGDREKILNAGFDGYISKPFDITTLLDDIQTILTHINRQP
jgi:two-component system, cell cycle response regulator DivK